MPASRAGPPGSWVAVATRFSSPLRAPRVQILEELVRSKLDLLVAPLGGSVVAGDQAHPVQPPEVAVHERVARLRLVSGAVGQAQVPERVVRELMRLQERVLLAGARLRVLPARPENVLVGVDQLLRVRDRVLVQRVGGDPPILTQSRTPRTGVRHRDSGAGLRCACERCLDTTARALTHSRRPDLIEDTDVLPQEHFRRKSSRTLPSTVW